LSRLNLLYLLKNDNLVLREIPLYSKRMIPIPKYHQSLLSWYGLYQRQLPWRSLPGQVPDPYHVWVSEIMLQQTTVQTVKEYYLNFLKKWPKIENLANAPLDDVFHMWQGLGYYRRARNLHKCAQMIHQEYKDTFPSEEKALLSLPGIGPYTAAAILSIAFNKPATVVDGNIERVMARLFQIETPLPKAKKEIQEKAASLTFQDSPGDYAQALMDLGSSICTPKSPACSMCPIHNFCQAFKKNPEDFPRRAPKKIKPTRYGTFFWIENDKGDVLIEKRPDKGLLAGMMGFPTSSWKEIQEQNSRPEVRLIDEESLEKGVRHTFTHFHLIGEVIIAKSRDTDGLWVSPKNLNNYALPTLMKKIRNAVQEVRQ